MADMKVKNRLVVEASEALVNGQQVTTTTNTQTLTNKSISGSSNTLTDIPNSALAGSIDATKIADGSVSNAEFQYLDGVTSSIQTQLNGKALDADVIKKDGSVAFTADQSMGGFKLTSLAAGTVSSDAATKGQLDAAIEGLKPKAAVRVATTANIAIATALNSGDVIDGVTLANGDRVLVKDQTDAEDNGIYVVSATPARSTDFDSLSPIDEINGSLVAVQEGTANAGKVFVQSGAVAVLDTDPINFVFFNSSSSLVGGDGITVSGSNISVDHDGEGLTFVSTQLALELDGSTLSKSASGLKVSDTTLNAKANTTLDNLGSTAFNADIIPASNNSRSLGSASLNLNTIHARNVTSGANLNLSGNNVTINTDGVIDLQTGNSIAISDPNSTTAIPIVFYDANVSNSVSLRAPDAVTADYTLKLPTAAGTAGQVLQTDASGNLSFVTPGAGYTNEEAQDAVGTILVDSATIDFTYDDGTPSITASVIDASITDAKIATGVDAAKIADGSVSNAEFQYLDGVTSSIQTQLNSKVSAVTGDIAPTSFSFANNQASLANVTGLAFANATTRSFKALVDIQLDATTDAYEVFELLGVQKGASWDMSVTSVGDTSGITFDITSAGQVQYTSANAAGFVSGTMKFRATTIPVA